MARTRKDHGFTALRIEGGILPAEFLQSIAALEAPRQTVTAYSLSKSLVLKEELARYWRIANDLYASYSERRQVGVDQWLVPLLRDILGYGGYSLARLRERALRRRHYDHHCDLYEGLRITFGALAQGVPALGLPALGGLFRADQCADLAGATLANERLLEAVRNLAFFRSGEALARVNYRDMGTEEFGSVYESLLELQPVVDVPSWNFGFVGDGLSGEKSRGSERKLTGSYYTPAALVNELIKSTLEPVLAQAVAACPENPRQAILGLQVIDPACGSGHFLLAAARRMAAEIARCESASGAAAHQQALREVVQHCIFGVDRNLLAVELCQTALWIETVDPGKPLTFLDSHILHGDSLVGVLDPESMAHGIPAEAYKPLTGDDKAVCAELKKRNRQAGDAVQGDLFDQDSLLEVAVATLDLGDMPEDTISDVERKRTAYEAIDRTQEERRANLLVGAYFAPKTPGSADAVPLTEDFNRLDAGLVMRPGVGAAVDELACEHGFFHWHIAFAEIMQDGGFDVVLGNPPWERIKLQEQEFFASRSPDIAEAPNKAVRGRLIKQLVREDARPAEKALFAEFQRAQRQAEAYLENVGGNDRCPLRYVELIVPRVLELTYTAADLEGFAPRPWLRRPALCLRRRPPPSPQVRTGRHFRAPIPARPRRPRMDFGRARAERILPGAQTQRDAGIRRISHPTLRPPRLRPTGPRRTARPDEGGRGLMEARFDRLNEREVGK